MVHSNQDKTKNMGLHRQIRKNKNMKEDKKTQKWKNSFLQRKNLKYSFRNFTQISLQIQSIYNKYNYGLQFNTQII